MEVGMPFHLQAYLGGSCGSDCTLSAFVDAAYKSLQRRYFPAEMFASWTLENIHTKEKKIVGWMLKSAFLLSDNPPILSLFKRSKDH